MMNIAMTCNDNDDGTLRIHDDTSIADHTNDKHQDFYDSYMHFAK